jgi:hypothetical protein
MTIKPLIVPLVLATFLMAGCTKTEIRYVEVSSPSTTNVATESSTSTTSTVAQLSDVLRTAIAACLESMPEKTYINGIPRANGLQRNVEECRDLRVAGLSAKHDSEDLTELVEDLKGYLAVAERIVEWDLGCEKIYESDNAMFNCRTQGMVLESFAYDHMLLQSKIVGELKELLS